MYNCVWNYIIIAFFPLILAISSYYIACIMHTPTTIACLFRGQGSLEALWVVAVAKKQGERGPENAVKGLSEVAILVYYLL